MTLYKWSQTASADATADSTINWAEGQSPSSVNDSARAMMAAIAKYRDDISGAIVTSGTSTAYTLMSYQAFDSISHLRGQLIAFVPHATNGGACTLNVDGLGAIPLRQINNVDLAAGTLIQSTPYSVIYSPTTGEFNFHNAFGNPYLIPIGASIDFFGATAPNSSFVLAYGQAISRTAYSTLFSLFGTTFGTGDGSTTFNIPDLRGRVVAGKGDMGGVDAGLLTATYFGAVTGANGATMGAKGGGESHALTTAQLAAHSHANTLNDPGHAHSYNQPSSFGASGSTFGLQAQAGAATTGSSTTGITINNVSAGSGNPHPIVQPTIIANKLLRII